MARGHRRVQHAGMTTTNPSHDQHQKQGGACCKTFHDDVARAAFCLYEKHGSQNGQDVQNWLDAEAHVKQKHASTMHGTQPTAKAAAPSAR